MMKEESSVSGTSAAGMKVKRLKFDVEDREKDKSKKAKKQDGGFKNRF